MKPVNPISAHQSGAVLILSLIILLVLTVLGVSAMSTSSLEERMTGNMHDQDVSFQAADSALAGAEASIAGWTVQPVASTAPTTSVWARGAIPSITSLAFNNTWWNTYGHSFSAPNLSTLYANPRYTIEQINFIPDSVSFNDQSTGLGIFYYRITSRSHGLSRHALTILQSTYATRFK